MYTVIQTCMHHGTTVQVSVYNLTNMTIPPHKHRHTTLQTQVYNLTNSCMQPYKHHYTPLHTSIYSLTNLSMQPYKLVYTPLQTSLSGHIHYCGLNYDDHLHLYKSCIQWVYVGNRFIVWKSQSNQQLPIQRPFKSISLLERAID
jgi:hypothetical protein